jgi:D-sedoheptulose 7-phosphate isomerase
VPAHYTNYLATLNEVLGELPADTLNDMEADLRDAQRTGKRVFLLGNGGSAATASHLVCDFGKSLSLAGRPRMKALALTDSTPLITAYGNDISYDVIFAEQLANFVEPGDVVIAISASGNSPNVLKAVELANAAGANTIGWTGFQGGKLKPLCRRCVVVNSDDMQQIEDAHLVIGHAIFQALRDQEF